MNTFPEFHAGQMMGVAGAVEPPKSPRRQDRYTVSTSHPHFSSSIPSLNPYTQTHTLTLIPAPISTPTPSDPKSIEAEMKDVVLNDWDENEPDDEAPEDGSLMINSNSTKGTDNAYPDPLLAADGHNAGLDALDSLTDAADMIKPSSDCVDSTGLVLKPETYNNSGSAIESLDAIFKNLSLGPSATSGAVTDADLSVATSAALNSSCGQSRPTATASRSTTDSILLTLNHHEEIVEEDPIRDFSKLNRSDWNELDTNAELLFPGQHYQLKTIKRKPECFPQRFPEVSQYLRQSSLLILSLGGRSADRYSKCCIPNNNRGGECRLHRFCSYCSWRAGQTAALTYVPAFDQGTWHFLTGSYTGKLKMNTPADAHDWLHYWEAYNLALRALVNDGDIRGVYWTEELALLSMLPVEVQPHVHCLIEADEVDEATVVKLKELVSQHLKAQCESALEPNIKVNSITSESSLFHHLRYMVKPINLVKAYDLAWTGAASHNRHQVHGLNSQMTDLVQGYSIVTTDRRKMNSKGNLDFRAKSFIGVHKKGHKKYLGHLKRINEQPHEYIEMPENDEESQTP